MVLGKAGGFFVSMAVALACLTTAITLAVVVSEFSAAAFLFSSKLPKMPDRHVSYYLCICKL